MKKIVQSAYHVIGSFFLICGGLSALIVFLLGIGYIIDCFGLTQGIPRFFGFFVAVIISPVTVVVGPWICLIFYHTWTPLIILYGGGFTVTLVMGTGIRLQNKAEEMATPNPRTIPSPR